MISATGQEPRPEARPAQLREAGTLLVDIIEAKDFKVRMQNYATRPTLKDLPADAKAARIQEVVDEILWDVRIGP
jgi:hypothetical protein